MSRYTFTGNQPNLCIVVGWDRPLKTYFAQVWDGGGAESGELLLWAGAGREPVLTVEELADLLAPFGTLPEELAARFRDEDHEGWDGLTIVKLLAML